MTKNSNISSLQHRNRVKMQSRVNMSKRAAQEAAGPKGTIENNLTKQQLQAMRRTGGATAPSFELEYPEWQALDDLYKTIAQGVVEVAEQVSQICQQVTAAGKADATFLGLVKNAVLDCTTITDQLVAVHEKHADKTGRVSEPMELDFYYQVGGAYNDIYEHFRSVAFQGVTEISTYTLDNAFTNEGAPKLQTLVDQAIQGKTEEAAPSEPAEASTTEETTQSP